MKIVDKELRGGGVSGLASCLLADSLFTWRQPAFSNPEIKTAYVTEI